MSNFWEWSKDISFVNRFIFPAPKPPSYNKDSYPDELLFVPPKEKLYHYYKQFKTEQSSHNLHKNNKNNKSNKSRANQKYHLGSPKYPHAQPPSSANDNNNNNHNGDDDNDDELSERKQDYCDEQAIPCIYIERKFRQSEATHLLLYLHGNAEDLGKCYPIIDYIRMKMQVNILAPEYPGYGVSTGDACETSVQQMVQNVYEFAISPYGLNVPPSRIIIYGFSIGSAAALSNTQFELNKVYLPRAYIEQKKQQKQQKQQKHQNGKYPPQKNGHGHNNVSVEEKSNNNSNSMSNDQSSSSLLQYKQKQDRQRKFFYSTHLSKCPHTLTEHLSLFDDTDDEKLFYTSEDFDMEDGDPFERLPLASLLNILRKGNVQYPTSVNKKELLRVARTHGLIPPLLSCKKANVVRKYSLLVIVCPFASISQVVADKIGVFATYLLAERFRNLDAITKVHGPLLIIHGKDDSIIPYQHSIELHKTAQKCEIQPVHLELLDGCDHNTMDLRKITAIINKFFKNQFNLCKSQKRSHQQQMYSNSMSAMLHDYDGYDADDGVSSRSQSSMLPSALHSPSAFGNGQAYPKTNHNHGRDYVELKVRVPSYCWLKPAQDAEELAEEDQARLKRKQEQDDEEYAFNLFMKQLLQHENGMNGAAAGGGGGGSGVSAAAMHNASASQLGQYQSRKLHKFFGDSYASETSTQSAVPKDTDLLHLNEIMEPALVAEPEYSISRSQALRLPLRDIIMPNDADQSGTDD